MSNRSFRLAVGLGSIVSLWVGVSFSHAQNPCLQSPEAFNQGSAARCASSLCGLDCFQCPQILAAASACGTSPQECPKTNPDTSCTKIKPIAATLTVGSKSGCPSGNSWALKTLQGTAYLTVQCDKGSVQTIRNVVFMNSHATATGQQCRWSYKNLSGLATWSEGKPATLSIDGFNRDVIVTDIKAAVLGSSVTFAGTAQAPLSEPTGYHSASPVSLSINAASSCDCNQ